ncbi:MAG: hypothetical protein KDK66_02810 [Deltaproteobacteria bacterium]|nr:hypothetical protein [Deltaproteobacteria bacterium]
MTKAGVDSLIDLGLIFGQSFQFFKGSIGKSINFKATKLEGGGYRLEFFSPTNNPGYGKKYIQELTNGGKIIEDYKETWGPNGLINTKWLLERIKSE